MVNPRSLNVRYSASRPSHCGVNPQPLATFTMSSTWPLKLARRTGWPLHVSTSISYRLPCDVEAEGVIDPMLARRFKRHPCARFAVSCPTTPPNHHQPRHT